MDPRSRRVFTVRVLGTFALLAGFLIALLTMSSPSEEAYVLAVLLVITGIGLRIEAAIAARPE